MKEAKKEENQAVLEMMWAGAEPTYAEEVTTMVDIGDLKKKGKEVVGDVKKKGKEVEGEIIKQKKITEGEIIKQKKITEGEAEKQSK